MVQTVEVRDSLPVMPGASDAYRKARERLRIAEVALRDQVEAVAAMRRALPEGPVVPEYSFLEREKRVKLAELFAPGKAHLILYHLMYSADDDEFCPMCSMWVDGFDAVAKHVERRANFVVASAAPYEKLQAWAKRCGWHRVRLLSDDGPTFARDTGAADGNGEAIESILVFTKAGSSIRHDYTGHAMTMGEGRGIDLLTPVWNLLDLLPSGRGDLNAAND